MIERIYCLVLYPHCF